MRILVTGASGFVGGHLVPELAAAGHEVVAATTGRRQAPPGGEVEVFDVTDEDLVRKVVERHRPEALVHLGALASPARSWQDPAETYRVNIMGTGSLLHAMSAIPGSRVLLVGSAQMYGSAPPGRALSETDPLQPASPYAVSKVAQEYLGKMYESEKGLGVVMVRAFNHTGPGQSEDYAVGAFCARIVEIEKGLRPPLMKVGRLEGRRDFLDVRDVVRAYRLLVEAGTPGEVYNVASSEPVRIGDLLQILLGSAAPPSAIEVVEDATPRAGDPAVLMGDTTKIRTALGWKPRIPIERSLLDTLDWYRENWPRR